MSDWAGLGEFPMTWRAGDLTITVPFAPHVSDDGFRVYGVIATNGRELLAVDPDMGFHNPPTHVPDPAGPITLPGPDGWPVRVRRDPLSAFRTVVTDAVLMFDGH